MTTPPFDPEMPDPFNLKKKTVMLPDPTDYVGKDPLFYKLALDHAAAQEDRNILLASQQWNNRMTGQMFGAIKSRLDDGDALLKEVKVIRKIILWLLASLGGSITIVCANWVSHLMHW